MIYKVLVVDDDGENRKFLKGILEGHGFSVRLAENASEAMSAASESRPDLILSDVAMPETDGLALCKRLRGDKRTAGTPIILMSGAHTDEQDQSEGIELGADDYLIKPFLPRLMLAKVRAVLQRYGTPHEASDVLKAEGLALDVEARTVTISGKRVQLNRKEFDLLATFLRKRGRVLSVPYLLETVWGYDPAVYNDPHTVEVHVSFLRRKLGPKLAKRIVTVSGLGYRFEK